jgi:hypothetical protein
MTIDLGRLAAGDVLVPEDAPPPIAFAADELARYLGRMFGTTPARRASRGPAGAWLALVPPGDALPDVGARTADAEWTARPAGAGAVLRAADGRAVLAAAYALLAAAGCEWSPHGAGDEWVPDRGAARAVVPALASRPAFARRAWTADLATWHYTVAERLAERLPHDVAFVDWLAKTDATGFLFIRHANDTRWTVPELEPELRRRGLALELGGHALVELLPRSLFAEHPEYFPLGATGRSDLGNVCVSSARALALVADGAATARRDAGGVSDLHLWGLDLFGGGWCACPGCAAFTPSDQSLAVCNAVADADGGRVFHLAYHDTIAAPTRVAPHPRVWAEFAPRERCYAHALDDPSCPTNPRYRRALEDHLERFAGRVDVFEYYSDAILFGGCAVPLVDVVGRDLECYRRAGVRGVSCLVFGRYSLWAYGANVEAFARGAVRPADAPGAVQARCDRRFAPAGAAMARYLVALGEVMTGVVTWGDVLLPPADGPAAGRALAALAGALAAGPGLRGRLADVAAAGAPPALVDAEERLLEYTLGALGAVHAWLAARRDAAAAERAVVELLDTIRHVRDVGLGIAGSWGAYDLEVTQWFFAAALRARAG